MTGAATGAIHGEAASETAATPIVPDQAASSQETAAHATPSIKPETEPSLVLGWTRGDRWFFGVMAAVILISVTIQVIRVSGWALSPITVDRPEARKYEFQLDVNSATWVEWMQLEGIGETLARRIVDDRDRNGPFLSIDDVARVDGIGPVKLEQIRPWLIFQPSLDHSSAPRL